MQGSRVRVFGLIGLLAIAIVAGAAFLPTIASSGRGSTPREVRLVVRSMTFYLEGEDKPNPALKFRAGEEVRLVLRNDDPGMNHDFAVPSWNVGTSLLEGKGETTAVFRVPDAPGRQIYTCTPHSQMMRGTIDVE